MRERPINLSGAAVRAALAGQKTQDRKPVTWPILSESDGTKRRIFSASDVDEVNALLRKPQRHPLSRIETPFGRSGDLLWVRESWCSAYSRGCWGTIFAADHRFAQGKQSHQRGPHFNADDRPSVRFRQSTHMPRWASRITLAVSFVRIERLQDISDREALAEGVHEHLRSTDGRAFDILEQKWCRMTKRIDRKARVATSRALFAVLWDAKNGKRSPWSKNDLVWVGGFQLAQAATGAEAAE